MPSLRQTLTLQPHLKFCFKQAKTSFDQYARPKPNHKPAAILFHQHNNRTSKECSWVFSTPEVETRSLRWESVLYPWAVEVLSTQSH